jgi:hypothetical protein
MRDSLLHWALPIVCAWVLGVAGCGGDSGGTSTVSSASSGAGGQGGASSSSGEGGDLTTVGTGGAGQGGGQVVDVCVGIDCPDDQHCEDVMDMGTCVNNTCADLNCGATEDLPGNRRRRRHLRGYRLHRTTPSVPKRSIVMACCAKTTTACSGDRKCLGDHAPSSAPPTDSPTSFNTPAAVRPTFCQHLHEDGLGHATCGCEDDWDCPGLHRLRRRDLRGHRQGAHVLAAPVDFKNALPVNEIQWGGTGRAPTTSP